jgi:hypothetical protein
MLRKENIWNIKTPIEQNRKIMGVPLDIGSEETAIVG